MSLSAIVIVGAIIFFVPIFIFVALNERFEWGWGDYDDDTPSTASETHSYTNRDLYGQVNSFTRESDDGAETFSLDGSYTISTKSGRDMYHYSSEGYRGRTHESDDGTRTHYDKDNRVCAYTKGNTHYDKWGLPIGSSSPD